MMLRYLHHCIRHAPNMALYNILHILFFPKMNHVIRILSEQDGTLVDLGCGSGIYSISCALSNRQRIITGIDLQPERCRCARILAQRLNLTNTRFVEGDFFHMPIPLADTYLLCDVLCYHPSTIQTRLLRQLVRQLPPGGHLIIKDHAYAPGLRQWMLQAEESIGARIRHALHTEQHTGYYRHGMHILSRSERILQLESLGLRTESVPLSQFSLLPHILFIACKAEEQS